MCVHLLLLCVARSLWWWPLTRWLQEGPLSGERKSSVHLLLLLSSWPLASCRTPTAYGIFRFKPDSNSISSSVMPDTLQVSPAGNMATVVVVSLDKMYVYVSRNFGQTWDRFNSPTTNFDPSKELYLSTFNPLNMVIRSRAGEVRGQGVWCACVDNAFPV